MSVRLRALVIAVVLHAAGAAFAMLSFLFFPEMVVDLVPGHVPLADVRHLTALMAVLPATFVAWDLVLLFGIKAGARRALLVGFVAGGAGILGALLHVAFARWSLAVADGTMGVLYVAVTWWNWTDWPAEGHPA